MNFKIYISWCSCNNAGFIYFLMWIWLTLNKSIQAYSHTSSCKIIFSIKFPLEQFLPLFKGSFIKYVCKFFRETNTLPFDTHTTLFLLARNTLASFLETLLTYYMYGAPDFIITLFSFFLSFFSFFAVVAASFVCFVCLFVNCSYLFRFGLNF